MTRVRVPSPTIGQRSRTATIARCAPLTVAHPSTPPGGRTVSDHAARAGRGTLLPAAIYERALEVGRRAAGVSGPNPPVGCLIVRDGHVIAEGWTGPAGGRHAEVVALAAAGERAQGAVAVVTLEPCAHQGRTAPCTDALLDAGVAEVHVLLRDPDPVAAGGLAILADGGVTTVDVGRARPDLRAMTAHDLRGFIARVAHGRPHVTLKLAQAVDGSTVADASRYLTGEDARRRVHMLRAESDAVLVGGTTVRTDDPLLDARGVPSPRQPRAVLLSTRCDVPTGARAVRAGTVLLHASAMTDRPLDGFEAAGVRLLDTPLDARSGGLDLASALASLLDERILTVLAEPGVRLAGALLAAQLVDAVELHVAAGAEASSIRPALPGLVGLLDGTVPVERQRTSDGDLILRTDTITVDARQRLLEGAA